MKKYETMWNNLSPLAKKNAIKLIKKLSELEDGEYIQYASGKKILGIIRLR